MSFFSFNTVGNALDAFQTAEGVTSDNISNVATPGASRQSADITQAIPISASPFYSELGNPGTLGEGSAVNQISRVHQASYDSLYRGAAASQYYYTTQQQQLTNLQNNFGEPSNGINSAYSKFQTAVSTLAANPTSNADRVTFLGAAQTFTNSLNSASDAITNQETSVMQQGTTAVDQANTYIDQIASLNGQIRALTVAGQNPNTYLDQRDYAIDQLSAIVPTTTSLAANGSSQVSIDGRQVVSDTIAYHLAAPVLTTTSSGVQTLVVGLAGDPTPLNPAPVPLGSGTLGALIDTYDNKLLPYGKSLDAFASSAAAEVNRVTEAGVDLNDNQGAPLFDGSGSATITAANIGVAISDPNTLPVSLLSTASGSLTQNMSSAANNTVSTSVSIDNYAALAMSPAAPLIGSLSIAVDGTTQTFSYNTTPSTGNSDTVGDFVNNFNTGHYGVTASFDPSSQTIVFARDPNNTDAVHRALQGASATTAGFTITDSNPSSGTTVGTAATSLLQALGANGISGVAQTPLNAYGSNDNGGANALTALFGTTVGIGALQTTVGTSSSATAGAVTLTQPASGAYGTVQVGQELTIVHDAGLTTQTTQNVTVSAIDLTTGTITVNATKPISPGDAISTTPQQTLGAGYQTLITQMGLDSSTANTGVTTQSALTSTIDAARQSVDGINIDEETQNLIMYQNAYSAAAKTLSTLNAMMQTTLNLISGG